MPRLSFSKGGVSLRRGLVFQFGCRWQLFRHAFPQKNHTHGPLDGGIVWGRV
jgi:hypothetical protein